MGKDVIVSARGLAGAIDEWSQLPSSTPAERHERRELVIQQLEDRVPPGGYPKSFFVSLYQKTLQVLCDLLCLEMEIPAGYKSATVPVRLKAVEKALGTLVVVEPPTSTSSSTLGSRGDFHTPASTTLEKSKGGRKARAVKITPIEAGSSSEEDRQPSLTGRFDDDEFDPDPRLRRRPPAGSSGHSRLQGYARQPPPQDGDRRWDRQHFGGSEGGRPAFDREESFGRDYRGRGGYNAPASGDGNFDVRGHDFYTERGHGGQGRHAERNGFYPPSRSDPRASPFVPGVPFPAWSEGVSTRTGEGVGDVSHTRREGNWSNRDARTGPREHGRQQPELYYPHGQAPVSRAGPYHDRPVPQRDRRPADEYIYGAGYAQRREDDYRPRPMMDPPRGARGTFAHLSQREANFFSGIDHPLPRGFSSRPIRCPRDFDQELHQHYRDYCDAINRSAKDAAADNKSHREALKKGLRPPVFRHERPSATYEYTFHNFLEKVAVCPNFCDYVRRSESHFKTDVHGTETMRDYRESITIAAFLDEVEAGNFLDAREIAVRRLKALWEKNQLPKGAQKDPWTRVSFFESMLTKADEDLLTPEERSAALKYRAAMKADRSG